MKERKGTRAGLLSEITDPNRSNTEPVKSNQNIPVCPSVKKEKWYQMLFNNISDSVFVNELPDNIDSSGHFIEVNDAACEHLGYTKEELLQIMPSDIDNKFQNIKNKSEIPDTLLKSKEAIWEGLLISKDGRKIPVEIHNRLFYKDGKKFILSTARDISGRKQVEEDLRKSEEKYHDLFDNANDAIYLSDADGNLTEVNHKAIELLGYTHEELIGKSIYNYIPKENLPLFIEMVKIFKERGGYDNFTVNVITKDERTLVVEISSSAIMEEGKYIGARTIVRDITGRILAEKALRESEERYRDLVENSPSIIYSYSDKRGIFYYSSRWENILGYSSKAFLEKPDLWKIYIHPEDHNKVIQVIKDISEGKHFNIEYRIKDNRDIWHWFEDRSISISKQNNETIINGLATDITKRKMMEQEIREMSITDQLTELYNRRGFLTLAEQQLKSAKRSKKRMTLLFLDSDGLKSINDALGHEEGDKALNDTADILRQTFRESDIIARIGGDEFAVLAVDSADMNSEIITLRLQQNVDNFNAKKYRQYNISLSWGSAIYDPDSALSLNKLMSLADELMYAQKRVKHSIDNYKNN